MVAPAKAGKFTFYWAASQGLAAERPTYIAERNDEWARQTSWMPIFME